MNSRNHVSVVSLALAGGLALAALANAENVDRSRYTPLDEAIEYPTAGCDGLVVQVPRSGTQFAPPADASPEVLAFYEETVRNNVTWVRTLGCEHTGIMHTAQVVSSETKAEKSGQAVETTYTTWNWSGLQQTPPSGQKAYYASGQWTVPTVVNPPVGHRYSTTGYHSSSWVGLGAGVPAAGAPLIQAGTTQDLSTTQVPTYYFWYEVVNGNTGNTGEVRSRAFP